MLPCSKCSADVANQDKETFDSFLGQADEVVQERVCDNELILVKRYVGRATPEGRGGVWQLCEICGIPSGEVTSHPVPIFLPTLL